MPYDPLCYRCGDLNCNGECENEEKEDQGRFSSPPAKNYQESDIRVKNGKSKNPLLVLIKAIFFIFILALLFQYLFLPLIQDEIAWRQATDQDSIMSYIEYWKAFPNGLHTNTAQQIYDDRIWKDVLMKNTREAYIQYLMGSGLSLNLPQTPVLEIHDYLLDPSKFSEVVWLEIRDNTRLLIEDSPSPNQLVFIYNGRYTPHALQKIDDWDWQQANSIGTQSAFYNYRRLHPSGKYITEVQEQIKELNDEEDWETAVASNTYRAFDNYLRAHQNGKYVQLAHEQMAVLPTPTPISKNETYTETHTIPHGTGPCVNALQHPPAPCP